MLAPPLPASPCQRSELSRGAIKAGGGRHSEKWEFLNCLGSLKPQGGMAERTNATVLKTVRPFAGSRGFKSHSLRQIIGKSAFLIGGLTIMPIIPPS